MTKYIIPAIAKDELQKKLEKISKKANAYGNHFDYSFGEEIVATRNIYKTDGRTLAQVDKEKVFAVELTIESDIIRKEGYTVVAQIECLEAGKNMVKMLDDETTAELEWYIMPLYCEHCHGRHVKRFSYIVKDESGSCKQVGKTCLKDYCGIDPKMIAAAQEVEDLILNDYDIDEYDFSESGDYAYDVLDVIAVANDIIKEYGYVKSSENYSTKSRLLTAFGRVEPSEESKQLAKKIKDVLSQMDYNELTEFQRNIKTMIETEFIRSNNFGYLAYAPVDFNKMMQKQAQKQLDNEAKAQSQYIGNIGEKINSEIKDSQLVTSWQTVYGWTHLYKFITTDGNTLVWYASKCIDGEPKKIAGTVKDHKEYDGEKQTILTRCKVIG